MAQNVGKHDYISVSSCTTNGEFDLRQRLRSFLCSTNLCSNQFVVLVGLCKDSVLSFGLDEAGSTSGTILNGTLLCDKVSLNVAKFNLLSAFGHPLKAVE